MRKAGYCESDDSDRCRFLRYVPPAGAEAATAPQWQKDLAKALATNAPSLPWPEHLSTGDSYCTIYPNRPPICRINGPIRPPAATDYNWYRDNLEKCGELAVRSTAPESKLIAIDNAILALEAINPLRAQGRVAQIIPIDSIRQPNS